MKKTKIQSRAVRKLNLFIAEALLPVERIYDLPNKAYSWLRTDFYLSKVGWKFESPPYC